MTKAEDLDSPAADSPASDDGRDSSSPDSTARPSTLPTSGVAAWLRNERFRRTTAFVVPIMVGIAVFMALRAGKEDPAKRPPAEQGKRVRVVQVSEATVVPRAVGYGVVQAGRQWEMVAQVSGRVIEMNEKLKVGSIMLAGTELLKIDPEDYELAATQRKAGVEGIQAQIAQLAAQEKSAKANLTIEEKALELAERDLTRTRQLFASGNATQSDVDSAERAVLTQRGAVQRLKNTLGELPANRAALQAQIRESKAGLENAALDISRTEMVAPFNVRVRELNVQPSEVVTAGQVLAIADGMAVAEVPAQLTLGALRPLMPRSQESAPRGPLNAERLADMAKRMNIEAIIRLESGDMVAQWPARVARLTTIDSTTRTVGVVVAVDEPFDSAKPGKGPPLLTGMYVEVELRGAPREGCRAVPRSALQDDDVLHVVTTDSRLERRTVTVAIRQATFACIGDELKAGERVVLTDLVPAVDGMLLLPTVDERATTTLDEAVAGRGDAK